MSHINPATLKQLRARKGWNLDELAHRSGVDRQTIHRIESGKQAKSRRTTIERLAKAFQTEAKALGEDLQDEESGFGPTRKSQVTIRMSNEIRNALNLVAMRYDIKPASIVHMAPLLFLWAAEESLKRRREKLAELSTRYSAVESIAGFDHLDRLLTCNWRGEEVMEAERRSITRGDIFGRTIPDDHLSQGYEESEQNPMAVFLAGLIADLKGLAEFEHWSPYWDEPGYTLGHVEVSRLVGDDEDAIHHILHGNVGLHEIPRETRESGPEHVAAWVNERGEAYWAELSRDLGGLIP